MSDQTALDNFRAYLRIPSVQPDVDYSQCVPFLVQLGEEIGLRVQVLEFKERPIVLMTLEGSQSNLGSILLNSHMDVVPVYPELWHHDPFGAEMDQEGNIYARGAQDAKCIGIQYLEAIRRLKKDGFLFKRTVHVSFVSDEEGGIDSVEQWVNSPYWAPLNVAFSLDEGSANEGPEFKIFYAEKAIWHVKFTVTGTEGHGSVALRETAGEKLRRLVDRLMDYRQAQMDKLDADQSLTVGDITFINFTMQEGGVAPNVVPPELSVTFDMRIAINVDHDDYERLLLSWCSQAGTGITINYLTKEPATPATPVDQTNPYWVAMQDAFQILDQKVNTFIFAGGTDSRFLRRIGIPCISFSPMNQTPYLAHANDEFLNKNVFLNGIKVYYELIKSLSSIS